jgi:hypothetical protein
MKHLLMISTLSICLISCASTQKEKPLSRNSSNPNPISIQEETIASTTKPEVRKVKIAKPGINPNTILNGVADVLVDGELESDSLKKENAIHVLIDDAVENTAEMEDTENQTNKIKTPR